MAKSAEWNHSPQNKKFLENGRGAMYWTQKSPRWAIRGVGQNFVMPLLNLISCKTKWLGTNKGSPTIKSLYSAYQYSYQKKYLYLLCRANSHFKNSILVELLDHSLLAYSPDVLTCWYAACPGLPHSITHNFRKSFPISLLTSSNFGLLETMFSKMKLDSDQNQPTTQFMNQFTKKIHKIIFMYINVELVELAGLTSSILNHPVWPVPYWTSQISSQTNHQTGSRAGSSPFRIKPSAPVNSSSGLASYKTPIRIHTHTITLEF